MLATDGAFSHNPGVWHGLDRCRDVLTAALALDGVVADPALGQVPHGHRIGEYKAKVYPQPNIMKTQGLGPPFQEFRRNWFEECIAY
jgi:hypothetical protein